MLIHAKVKYSECPNKMRERLHVHIFPFRAPSFPFDATEEEGEREEEMGRRRNKAVARAMDEGGPIFGDLFCRLSTAGEKNADIIN